MGCFNLTSIFLQSQQNKKTALGGIFVLVFLNEKENWECWAQEHTLFFSTAAVIKGEEFAHKEAERGH